jgi:NADH-quinone oxidoreductase subunit A
MAADPTFWKLALYASLVVALTAGMLCASALLGKKTRLTKATVEPFESGIVSVGDARLRLSAKFYLVAMLFVIFDLEAVYLVGWAVAARQVGWMGYVEILVFVGVLVAALLYLWRAGALDWAPRGPRRSPAGPAAH